MKSKDKVNGYKFICIQSSDGPQLVSYKLERSRRLKRMRIQIDSPDYVTLKMPMRMAEKHGTRFLEEHGEWILQSMAELPRVPSLQTYLVKNPRLSVRGRWYSLQINFRQDRSSLSVDDENFSISFNVGAKDELEQELLHLLKATARKFLPLRVLDLEPLAGVRSHGVIVRDQKSRWGSCSETGGISLNWRLILVPPKLQDHVLLHELAHIRHFDHSKDFHKTLAMLDPQASAHARQLNGKVSRLLALGQAAR